MISGTSQTQEGLTITLICQTSASFPASMVTWSYTPPGATPSVRTETTTGVLKKTISTLTFSADRTQDGRSIQCTASNIAGQTSPSSSLKQIQVWCKYDGTVMSGCKSEWLAGYNKLEYVCVTFELATFDIVGWRVVWLCWINSKIMLSYSKSRTYSRNN